MVAIYGTAMVYYMSLCLPSQSINVQNYVHFNCPLGTTDPYFYSQIINNFVLALILSH